MRTLLLLLAGAWLLVAAGDKFSGKWTSTYNSEGGAIHIQVSEPADVSFTLGGETVKGKVVSSKVAEDKFEIQYEFEIDGNKLVSTLTGNVSGQKMEGKYQTRGPEGNAVDAGTFVASAGD